MSGKCSLYVITQARSLFGGRLIKIGVSKNPASRAKRIKYMTGFHTRVLWQKEYKSRADAVHMETNCKQRFAPNRQFDSEWYQGVKLRTVKAYVNQFDRVPARRSTFVRVAVDMLAIVAVVAGLLFAASSIDVEKIKYKAVQYVGRD